MVPFDGSFQIGESSTSPPAGAPGKGACKRALKDQVKAFRDLQDRLYASDSHSVLLVFQAMDAAGKDSTIRAVTSGVNPAGFQVHSFKSPSKEELDHDFLWRTNRALPERGRIGVFNRSYYEETLVVRVHPEFLAGQRLPVVSDTIWEQRYASIRSMEEHLAHNGTLVLKFWLNVSRREQLERFKARIDRPEKNWKFSETDLAESRRWNSYMEAYEQTLNATSRPWAPWFAIPADDKPFMRLTVARIVVDAIAHLDLQYPKLQQEQAGRLDEMRDAIVDELDQLG
mgnify:CR=1 FL=1